MLTGLAGETKLQPSAFPRLHRRCKLIINVNGHPGSGDDVALFIDWENFKISLAAGNRTPNVTALKEEVANHGRVVVAKAYADWVTRSPELRGASQFINDPPALYAAGIEPVYVPTRLPLGAGLNSRTTRVKNSVDVKMTADCIECAHSYPNIGMYVLVSGDSDFIHVINSLRAIGKQVIIIGVSWSTSRRLADQVDGLILYDADVDTETPHERTPVNGGRTPTARTGSANRQQLSDVMRVIEEIVRAERQAGRTPLLTSLKQRIMRRVPGFDEKKLGFSGFKKLLLRTAEEGNIKLVTVGLVDWVIMADEPDPEEAMAESQASSGAIESVAADEEVIPEIESETGPETPRPDYGAGAVTDSSEMISREDGPPIAEAGTPEPSDSLSEATQEETEAREDAEESEERQEETPAVSPELEKALEEILSQLELPKGPGDGQDARRITDLVIMADTLEHRDEVSHVAFNFLLGEICDALQQGLEAEHPEITGRWGGRIYSRNYVTRLLRSLGEKDVFVRDWHQAKSEETGRNRRFRTFTLNRVHPLVKEALVSQWGPEADVRVEDPDVPAAEAPPAEEQPVHSEAFGDQVTDVQDSDAQASDAQATDAQATDAQATDAQATEVADSGVAAAEEPIGAEVAETTAASEETSMPAEIAPVEGAVAVADAPAVEATDEEPAAAEAAPKRRPRRAPSKRRREPAKQPAPASGD